ncbi:MAG: hypothetical protein JXA96_01845 [Sedimentisphaerales bacterium]|nr:hypothetical protein [Sedimentisphaerales bacterium]
MCRLKWGLLVILAAFPVLRHSNLQAASTGHIDNVRKKSVLNDQDKKIIDDFVRESVNALINEKDFTNIARHRDAIASRKDNKQVQYVNQFKESTVSHITKAFETARNIKQAKNQTIVTTNLLILIDKLDNVQFAILAKNMLDDKNAIVRYWAVKCLANPEVINQLNSGEAPNPGLPKEITTKLINIVPKSSPQILNIIASYAAAINIPQGQELLLKIADQRIADYADWSVKLEYIDGNILKMLENVISEPGDKTNVPAFAQRFAQLYSYIIQRYIQGKDFLDSRQIAELVTVIIETENTCIKNMVGTQQSFKKAIEKKQLNTLMDEHNKLLGSNTTQGQLPAKFNFNYGQDENGSIRNAPLTLSDPK